MSLSKDADMSPFEAGRKLLALDSGKLTLSDRIDLVFQDADLVPLLVQVGSSCLHAELAFQAPRNDKRT